MALLFQASVQNGPLYILTYSPLRAPDTSSLRKLFGLIAVRDRYDQEQSLRAGRIWQRADLFATARGVAGRPATETVEMVDHERSTGQQARHPALLAELTGDTAWEPTFMFYVGYAVRPGLASPRGPWRWWSVTSNTIRR